MILIVTENFIKSLSNLARLMENYTEFAYERFKKRELYLGKIYKIL